MKDEEQSAVRLPSCPECERLDGGAKDHVLGIQEKNNSIVFDKWSLKCSTKAVLPRICPESGLGCLRRGFPSEQQAAVGRAGTNGDKLTARMV